ncbi:DUF6966 domain-containing protein [Glutamicibacter ardleyensis]|uniref:DUF6966 domain-containing protein n=1 Tax=Glutamicibacter ardleyensis TaxID=225894 RepID=UPI003FD5FB7F
MRCRATRPEPVASFGEWHSQRSHRAGWLDSLFADIETPAQLRESANEALKLYRGGMGSFQDVGTAVMAQAVDGLHAALGAARSAALRN